MSAVSEELDPFEARLAAGASGLLREFNRAGVLSAADVHVARRLGQLGSERDERVLLAVALAVRAPRLGHVHVDLESIRGTAAVESENPVDLEALPWPDVEPWLAAVAASPLVADAAAPDRTRPLRLEHAWLYLDRYWSEEVAVADALRAMRDAPPADVDEPALADGVARLFGLEADGDQARAAVEAVRRRFAVVAGGPGTGKTTTVARIVALLCEQSPAAPAADRARRPDREGVGAAAGGRARGGRPARHLRLWSAPSCKRCRRRRSTGCSATAPGVAAASATTANSDSHTTS